MFGKQKTKKVEEVKPIEVEEETIDLEVEPRIEETTVESEVSVEVPETKVSKEVPKVDKIKEAQDKIKQMEKELEDAREEEAKALAEVSVEEGTLMEIHAVKIIGPGVYEYTTRTNKLVWAIGSVLKL